MYLNISRALCTVCFAITLAFTTLSTTSCGGNKTEDKSAANADTAATVAKQVDKPKIPNLDPKAPKPEFANDIEDNMWAVLVKQQMLGGKPLETLTPAQARMQPTPADAVMSLMTENNMPMAPSTIDTMGIMIPVKGASIHARVYKPKGVSGPLPVVVYYHGGGFVIANSQVYDASAKGVAEGTGAIVVSVDYRLAPEHKFPTAHMDAFEAYKWVVANAASMGGDPKKVAVMGESAGGNLACNVSIMARDQKVQMPTYQVLVYPVANNDMNSESYKEYAQAKPLNKAMMGWFVKYYLPNAAASADPRISLVKANLAGLPATTIIAAEIDPLATEGKLLSDKLKDAGVKVNYSMYDNVTHEFYGMASLIDDAQKASAEVAKDLKGAFGM